MKIENVAVESLVHYARNSRTHSDEQVAQIVASIREFGFTNPVLIDEEDTIIAGHGRTMAAKAMGLETVPCVRLVGLSEAQRRAYVIADNRLALNAGWNEEMLRLEIADLKELKFDLDLLGFGDEEIEDYLAFVDQTTGLTDENSTPPAPEFPSSRLGDLWVLGRHRIICGSSTEADVVAALLDGCVPHLMVTDSPYGVEYDASWRDNMKGNVSKGAAKGKVLNDDRADWREAWALFPGDVAYVWHASTFSTTVAESLRACKFDVRANIVWAKSQLVISRGHYHPQREPCWYAVKKNATAHWQGSRKQTTLWRNIGDVVREGENIFLRREEAGILLAISEDESTVWEIPKPLKSETGHSTQKPVECMRRPILNNSKPGDSVYEPFSGSGTTIIAAEMTGRCCFAVELNPLYVDIAVQRWQQFTGKQATLAGDGRTFEEISAERCAC